MNSKRLLALILLLSIILTGCDKMTDKKCQDRQKNINGKEKTKEEEKLDILEKEAQERLKDYQEGIDSGPSDKSNITHGLEDWPKKP